MPYSGVDDPNLPSNVKELPVKKRRQWIHVFNNAIEDEDDEGKAFAKANGVADKSYIESWDIYGRQITQEKANYNAVGGNNEKACANCRWFVSPDGCILVGGTISPTGISNYWMEPVVYEPEPIPVTVVEQAEYEEPKVKKVIEHVINFAKGMIPKKEQPLFTLYKDDSGRLRFFAMPSNMYIDRQNHIIKSVAHKDFVNWVDENKIYPELWMWHVPGSRIGECDWLDFTPNGMLCASGTIDEGFENVAQGLATKDIAMSHGFFRLRDGNDITKYRSFEISVLPVQRAANFGTDFLVEQREMSFTDEKRKFFAEAGVSEGQIKQWEEKEEKFGQEMKKMGIAWKEGEEQAEGAQQEQQASEIQALTSAVLALTDKVTSLESGLTNRVEAVEKSFDDKVADAMQSKIAAAPQGFKPSEDDSNKIDSQIETKGHEDSLDWFYGEVVGKVGGN